MERNVITAFNGQAITSKNDLLAALARRKPGDGVTRGSLSVTIVGPDLATADAYATAAYAMGRDGPPWTAHLVGAGYEAMTILGDQTVLSTPAFPALPTR